MIAKFNDTGWERFDSIKKGDGFFVSEDGTYVRLFDENPYAALKKVMYTGEIENEKTYTLTVPYKIKNIKHKTMLYGLITLYDRDDKQTRRIYLNNGENDELEIVFQAKDEVKVRIELGLKAYGDICFYNPSLKVCGEIKKKI